MAFAWLSLVLGTAFNVAMLYYTVRADRRAERDRSTPATTPRPRPGTTSRRPSGSKALPDTGGFVLWVGYVELIFIATTAVYTIPNYMVRSYGSVQDYAGAFRAGVVITVLTAFGLAASAWIRARTDLRLTGRITRKIIYFHALIALAGLIVSVTATVTNPQYVL